MPAYDFYCQKCKKDFCLTLSIQGYEKKNFSCPHCKGKERRLEEFPQLSLQGHRAKINIDAN